MSSAAIHPTAIIEDGAEIGSGTTIGAYSIIGSRVKIGENNRIASHVVITGNTVIGDNNEVFQFASVGDKPQDLKYRGEDSVLRIGSNNRIREYVTLQPGTEGGGMTTSIGNQNLFMATVHVGHDCIIGNGNILANGVAVAGHVNIGDYVILGGLSGIHQFVNLGDHALIGAGSMVNKDIPPFCMAQGDRAGLTGIHQIGLERRGFNEEQILALKAVYRSLLVSKELNFKTRLENLLEKESVILEVQQFLNFVKNSQRGIAPTRKS